MIGNPRDTTDKGTWTPAGALKLAVAVVVLNCLLTFHNLWPTLWPRLSSELSLEVVVLLALLVFASSVLGRPRGWWLAVVTAAFSLLVLGRYIDVTAGGLFGRPLDLYWDLPHAPAVIAMAFDGEPAWRLGLMCLAVLIAAASLVAIVYWALRTVTFALTQRMARLTTGIVSAALLGAYVAGMSSDRLRSEFWFSLPVVPIYAKQGAAILEDATRGAPDLSAFAAPASDLQRLEGADVYLLFFESYGANLLEDPERADRFRPKLASLSSRLARDGWHAASALFISPTFGGASWLAHASVLSGTRIDNQAIYRDYLRSDVPSLVTRFQRAGYRAVALMPGIKQAWPEGAGLGFDEIYSAKRLDYRGAAFGWWRIPDQFSLARALELESSLAQNAPLLLFFPTIMSHMPFQPIPPYEPDWTQVTMADAFPQAPMPRPGARIDPAVAARAYVEAIDYDFALLEGFLDQEAAANALVIVSGDHQPPALVSGPNASWRVPVHILSRDPAKLAAFVEAGFAPGLPPGEEDLGGIERLNRLLLGAFDSEANRMACAGLQGNCK